ncbi:SusC/RagA family TonB-linked outer membrane protein [Chryseobacterium sp.]|uniref:SusC/RagA family TonB-linked outer membrane protein n=1 Tax=Chryseobacterium sp. TaxID=1871047 RepID=UPI0011CA6C95|nr:SusC/RagA family TonB-linked outer membrane protein [Chryseobacterium sp.]TXF79291.1 SusC/RagA family TonB-linked outer membrane protein [Chryseobacterium sp.]
MKFKYSKSLGLIAALYFTSNVNAQVQDSLQEKSIEEVVLIGYGSVKKQQLTSAVSTVKADAFAERPIYNAAQALQGNASGVQVVQPSGKPGAAMQVKIRGNNSISSDTNPLYVVDGIQTYDISGINPNDIVEMTVLKDATSTAIYGVNGSSGVVIVTTKKGKSGTPQLSFNAYWGVSKVVNNIDVLNLDQYKTLIGEINPNYLITANDPKYAGINTNWKDEVYQTGFDQNYNVSYAFGSDGVRVYTALGYQGISGIIKPSKFDRVSAKVNLDADLAPWLKLNTSLNYFNTQLQNTSDNLSTARGGVVLSALNTPAFLPIYGSQVNGVPLGTDGQPLDGYKPGQFTPNPYQSSWENPVAYQSSQDDFSTNRFMSNLGLEVRLAKGFTWKPSASYEIVDLQNDKFTNGYLTNYGRQNKGIGSDNNTVWANYFLENTLNYNYKSGKHDLALLLGHSIQENKYTFHGFSGNEFPEGTTMFDVNLAKFPHEYYNRNLKRYMSEFGRAVYTFNNKYTLMAVFRATGASQLADGNKWGLFPGVSASWMVSNEDFLKDSPVVSEFKIRGGWGKTGNVSAIPDYAHFALNSLTELGPNGVWNYSQLETSDLTWETTADTNIGVDLGFANQKIKLTLDAYQRKTSDLIIPITLPLVDFPFLKNAGDMENKGIEVSLNTQNFKREDFSWSTNFNISSNKNKITKINYLKIIDDVQLETVGERAVRLQADQAVGAFFGYMVDKVDPATGTLLYKDLNGNGDFDPGDRTFIGNPNPKFTFGFSNNFTYKGAYLDVLFTGSEGNDIFNASRLDLEMMNDFKNQSTVVLDRWTTPGQITNIPKANDPNALHLSDRFIEDGSFIKLKAVTLGYNFKNLLKGVSSLNLYLTGQNLVTWTKYTGFDPEVNAFSTTAGVFGIDYGTYPQVQTYIVGLKANF